MAEKPKDKSPKDAKAAASDMDALDRMSLSIIPLSTATLKNAKLIKNARMETAVELHNDPISGSLQIQPEDIADAFSGAESDQTIITALASLNSYDVYSMRTSLRKLNIDLDDSVLDLSAGMKESLSKYTSEFTRPLIAKIFGAGHLDDEIGNSGNLSQIFRDSDAARVRNNLQIITTRTGIPIAEIPAFLESYSDIFLSIAYYRYSFENLLPEVERFMVWMKDLQKLRDVTSSPQAAASCKRVEDSVRFLTLSVRERLKLFNKSFEAFWGDINKRSFDQLSQQVESNHTNMGAVLCGLAVKMRNWTREFPENTVGGPQKRLKFIISDMEPGLEKLKKMEQEARKSSGLPVG